MRTFVTWRFWLTMLVLAGMTFGLLQLTKDDASAQPGDTSTAAEDAAPPLREIDLIAPVFLVQADEDASLRDGVTTGRIQVRVDGFRYMNIAPGTPGENRCPLLTELASCVVAADLLGEAVLWFALLPAEPKSVVTLPAIAELLDGGRALLNNGWSVQRSSVIERECDDDTTSLAEFLRTYGPAATSTFSLDRQLLTTVTCPSSQPSNTVPPATIDIANR